VAAAAQAWANHGVFQHSHGSYGENLALGHSTASDAVRDFYNEKHQYSYGSPGFSGATGHFTQLVWASSQKMGIGLGQCDGRNLYVFQYDPPGNVDRGYEANVKPEGT
jgi:hypothetical protein